MTLLSNPRLAIVWLMLPVILAAGAATIALLGLWPIGLISLVAALYIVWTLAKVVRRQMRTRIHVGDDGVRFDLYGEETLSYQWTEVKLAGLAIEEGKRGRRARKLFLYKEEGDRLMSVPDEFERFDELVSEVRSRAHAFRDLTIASGETLKGELRRLLLEGQAEA